jgi:hypothetical protein
MLVIRVGKDIVALTPNWGKALCYLTVLSEQDIPARIDTTVSDALLDHWEHMQLAMDDYMRDGGARQ